MGAPNRRSIYVASLEAHVDSLHAQLLTLGLYPVPFEKLERYRGLNSKTAKVRLSNSYCWLHMLIDIVEHGGGPAARQLSYENEIA